MLRALILPFRRRGLHPSPPADDDVATAVRHRVRAIEVRARSLLRRELAGEYRSAFRGRGLEFHQIRAYLPGDDVRFIDWRVTARRATLFVKQFVEERELTVLLVLDVSASQSFGTVGRSVRDFATEVAGVIGYAAALSNDRVGALAFSDRLEYSLPPRKGVRHVLRLLHDLIALRPLGRGTDLPQALDYAGRLLRRGSVIVVVSDFHADGWDVSLRRLARKHDVLALVVRDPRESAIPAGGLLALEDAESRRALLVDAGRAARALRVAGVAEDRALRERLRAADVDFAVLTAGQQYVQTLAALFRARTWRQ